MFSVKEILQATGGKLLHGKSGLNFRAVSIDSRTIRKGDLFIALGGDRFDGHSFIAEVFRKGASGAVVDRQKRFDRNAGDKILIGVSDTLRALQEIAHFHRKRFDIPVVGITGSNGKTTTKEMAASILARKMRILKTEGNLNNHIGVPLTLLTLNRTHRLALVEMGINHRGELKRLCEIARPSMGLITNIGPTHLEFLRNIEGVAKAKGELLQGLDEKSPALLNADDPFTARFRRLARGPVVTFGFGENIDEELPDFQAIGMTPRPRGFFFQLNFRHRENIPMRAGLKKSRLKRPLPEGEGTAEKIGIQLAVSGRHNVYNASGAAAIATLAGVDPVDIKKGLESFEPVRLRSQMIRWRGIRILNDSYNANPASMRSALDTLNQIRGAGRAIAVLGDMLELGGRSEAAHREIGREAKKLGIDYVITVGELAGAIGREAVRSGMPKDRVAVCGDLSEGLSVLKKMTRDRDTILVKGSRGMKMEKIVEGLMGE